MGIVRRAAAIGLMLAAALVQGGCGPIVRRMIEVHALTTPANGSATPASVGAPYQQAWIPSGPGRLDAYVVTAPAACGEAPALLIYHGVGETISDWVGAQKFLYDRCVTSVVFDYTGGGDSSRPARFEQVNQDGVNAYEWTRRRLPRARLYVLAHSMGNAILLQAIPRFSTPPAGVVAASPFVSLRDFALRAGGWKAALARLGPDYWDNVIAVRAVDAPLLLIHSDSDRVNPLAGGEAVFAAAPQPKTLVVLHGHGHNDLYRQPTEDWWAPVLMFIGAPPRG